MAWCLAAGIRRMVIILPAVCVRLVLVTFSKAASVNRKWSTCVTDTQYMCYYTQYMCYYTQYMCYYTHYM